MIFTKSDMFVRYLQHKAHTGWSTTEIVGIFKHRYGENFENALANMLIDSIQTWAPKLRKNKQDREYAEMWDKVMDKSEFYK